MYTDQDGMTWVLNRPEESLAMILADNGFDVWISNIRGTRFSRRHVNLHSSDPVSLFQFILIDFMFYEVVTFFEYIKIRFKMLRLITTLGYRNLLSSLLN